MLGTLVAAWRVSPVPPLRLAGAVWVEVVRNTPLAVLMLVFFFGFTKIGIGPFEPFPSALVVLSAYTSAFVAEAVRSGINAVAVGQAEAARALGLTFPQVLRHVVLPQAFRTVVPPLGNLFIALTKNTSVAFLISAPEIMKSSETVIQQTGRTVEVLLVAAALYLMLTLPSGYAFGWIERKVAIKR